jgi:GNAT superfamily N-acetyltransferase
VSEIRVVPVVAKRALRAFIRFPHRLYRDAPNWVPPLDADIKERLDVRRNPFFEHAEREAFLAFRDGEPVGRIVGVVDAHHNAFHGEKVVFFGMYESVDDAAVAKALLDAVAEWGRRRGMNVLRGPVNLSLNDECAFLLDGYDSPPAVMMPYNPRYYHGLMEACGLGKAKDLYAFHMDRGHRIEPRVQALLEKMKAAMPDLVVRTFEAGKWKEESEKIKAVYNNGWVKNWGFVPWTEKEMAAIVKKLKQIADFRVVVLAESKGRPVGFAFALPDYNQILIKLNGRLFPFGLFRLLLGRKKIKGIRILVFGIVPELRNTGLSYLLYQKLEENAQNAGYEWAETSWQLEDNQAINRFVASIGGRVYKTYRIYEREIG